QERHAFGHSGDGDDVGRVGGELRRRDPDHRVGGDFTVATERGPLPADALAGRAHGLRGDRELAASRTTLHHPAAFAPAIEERARGQAAGRFGGGGRWGHRGSRPNRLTSTVAVLPPSVWVSPTVASSTWRRPASPRSWVAISATCAAPVAPIGWPLALSP